jgi:hypothetical protein
MNFLRESRVLVVLSCVALIVGVMGCSSSKVTDYVDQADQGGDAASLSPEEQVFRYATTGDAAAMEALLKTDPTLVNLEDVGDYRTPLHVAAFSGNAKIVDILLKNGADPRAEDANGFTPADAARDAANVSLANKLDAAAAQNAE